MRRVMGEAFRAVREMLASPGDLKIDVTRERASRVYMTGPASTSLERANQRGDTVRPLMIGLWTIINWQSRAGSVHIRNWRARTTVSSIPSRRSCPTGSTRTGGLWRHLTRPANAIGQYLAVSETALGVILLAILVFVFGRRATR